MFFMTKDELQKLDTELAAEEATLREELKEVGYEASFVKGDYQPKVEDLGHSLEDAAQEAGELDRNQALVDTLKRRLEEIIETRSKIKNGTYGSCVNCSSNIEPARLKASPAAAMCIDCAQKADLL